MHTPPLQPCIAKAGGDVLAPFFMRELNTVLASNDMD